MNGGFLPAVTTVNTLVRNRREVTQTPVLYQRPYPFTESFPPLTPSVSPSHFSWDPARCFFRTWPQCLDHISKTASLTSQTTITHLLPPECPHPASGGTEFPLDLQAGEGVARDQQNIYQQRFIFSTRRSVDPICLSVSDRVLQGHCVCSGGFIQLVTCPSSDLRPQQPTQNPALVSFLSSFYFFGCFLSRPFLEYSPSCGVGEEGEGRRGQGFRSQSVCGRTCL